MKNLHYTKLIFFCLICSVSLPILAQHSTYYHQKKSLFEQLPGSKKSIIFIGDSITDGCEWSEMFGNKRIKNRGISGDVTQGILDRLDHILSEKPKKIFLMIGVNDLARGISAELVIQNILNMADRISLESPKTELYIQSILPVNDHYGKFNEHTKKSEDIKFVNREIDKNSNGRFHFIDLHSSFINTDGKLNIDFSNDGLHLNGDGYKHWKGLIEKLVN